jgi:phospholipid/cholesterol/gamma-HCH transport system substrate-binding protein
MSDQGKNLLTGLFTIAACTVLIWTILFLNPTVGNGKQILRVRFTSIEGIKKGTRVTFAGKPIGQVIAINQVYDARQQPTDPLGLIYFYEVIVAVDSSVHVYNTDEIVMHTTGLFGEKSIAILPRSPAKGVVSVAVDGSVIYGISSDRMEQTFTQVMKMANQMGETFELISNLITAADQDLLEMIHAVRIGAEQFTQAMESVNEDGAIGQFSQAMCGLSSVMARVDTQLAIYEEDGFWDQFDLLVSNSAGVAQTLNQPDKLGTIIDNLDDVTTNLSESWPCIQLTLANLAITARKARQVSDNLVQMSDKIISGDGTLGKLVEKNELYLRMTSVMNKAETMMNDINHYGLLFHLNRGWQRCRTQRAGQICSLNSAAGFHEYVDQELDQINTSLCRVSLLIERAEACGMSDCLLHDREFAREFCDLLERVGTLEESLQLYNAEILKQRAM